MTRLFAALLAVLLAQAAAPALADDAGSSPGSGHGPADATADAGPHGAVDAGEAGESTDVPPSSKPGFSVSVKATSVSLDGARNPLASAAVVVRAARPKGPFEPREPEPSGEWVGRTDATGAATIHIADSQLLTSGQRLHAAVVHNGVVFRSAAVPPMDGIELKVDVFERATSADGVQISELQMIVEPWEGYLVFTQDYVLTYRGNAALDFGALPGFEDGLPVALPKKAQGIHVSSAAPTKTVDNHVFWQGVMLPGQSARMQVRFSMAATKSTFVFDQTVGYPIETVNVIAPVQTRHEKVPRLPDLALAAPGFDLSESTDVPALAGVEVLAAKRSGVDAGVPVRFQLSGLPFRHPVTPWFFVGAAVACVLALLVFIRRERDAGKERDDRRALIENLRNEREALFSELVRLEQQLDDDEVDPAAYEAEVLYLRERLALVMNKLSEFEGDPD